MKDLISGLFVAFALYSKIPVPRTEWTKDSMRYALAFLPLVGLAVGALELGWLRLAQVLGVNALLYAVLAAAIPVLVTGGIHLDGFTDTCDALASWGDREKRLEILKDPHVGAFGVMYLAVLLLIQCGLYAQFYQAPRLAPVLLLLFPLARCFGGLAIVALPCAKGSGLAHTFAQASHRKAVGALLLLQAVVCLLAFFLSFPLWAAAALALSLILLPLYRRFCLTVFGGVTGDLAGWCITLGETLLLTLCALGALV